jgi:GT2 family glycosyltransferase
MTELKEIQVPIYIILVNYGNWQDTVTCLQSLESFAEIDVNVVIVDVEDLDGSYAKLREATGLPGRNRYRLLQQPLNKGFAHACNVGIRLALEENPDCFIWLLNNDTLIMPGSLRGLINCHREAMRNGYRKPGFIGSVIVYPGDAGIIQFAGGIIDPVRARLIVQGEGESLARCVQQHGCPETDWIMGASMFFHASVVRSIGFMPEDYFLYYEDIDWSLQAIRKGYANLVSHQSVIVHKQGSSTGQDYNSGARVNPVTTWYFYKSYLAFFKKNYPHKTLLARAVLLKQMAGKLVRGDFRRFSIILKVLLGIGLNKGT